MDLIGEFHPASSKGNRYALTAVCMLTGFTFCIPLKSKRAEDVIRAIHQPHMLHIHPIEENINGQWNRVQEQAWGRDIREAEN